MTPELRKPMRFKVLAAAADCPEGEAEAEEAVRIDAPDSVPVTFGRVSTSEPITASTR